jgi:hypothetical protein
MGIFSKPKRKDELVLVFNIGSTSVSGALLETKSSGIPKIIFSTREPIQVEEKIDVDRFFSLAMQSLEIVTRKIYENKLGVPKRIFCFLASPWCFSQTRIINLKKNTPFVFTEKLADELIQKEIKLFEDEYSTTNVNTNNSVLGFELKNIKTVLNGYETTKPLGQKTKELEMTVFVSASGDHILKKIKDTIMKYFQFENIKFSSFVLPLFTVVRDTSTRQENFLLIDIEGEMTDIFMVKKNILCESISFPLGRNFLTRGISSGLRCSLDEAHSFISLFLDRHAEEFTAQKILPIINELRTEWLKKFQESLVNLSNDISIPATIYMVADKDLADFFSDTIKTEQFSQYTLTESKFKIIFLSLESFQKTIIYEKNKIYDPALLIDSVYINNFLMSSFAPDGRER